MLNRLKQSSAPCCLEEVMNSDLSGVVVGDFIWTIESGWVEVVEVRSCAGFSYPIRIVDGFTYTLDGRSFSSNVAPSAFIEPPTCFNPEPKPCRFKRGDRVLVRDYDNVPWRRRYFAGENPDQPQERFGTFSDGADEWGSGGRVRYWKYCKPWKEGEEE